MIIGNGLVANAFKKFDVLDNTTLFCSGVSNSLCIDSDEFNREQGLLKESIKEYTSSFFVYFSTCSIDDPSLKNSLYVKHKLNMEKLITENCSTYVIFRLSNVIGRTKNKSTIINFFLNCIRNDHPFDLWISSYRNIIDIDDLALTCNYIIANSLYKNQIINVANPISVSALNLVKTIEQYTNKKGKYTKLDKGENFDISINEVEPIYNKLNIVFKKNYILNSLKKHEL